MKPLHLALVVLSMSLPTMAFAQSTAHARLTKSPRQTRKRPSTS